MNTPILIPISNDLFFDGNNLIENGNVISLGSGENNSVELLALLLQNRGDLVTFQQLFSALFPSGDKQSIYDALDFLKSRCPALKDCIQSVRGKGYKLVSQGTLQLKPQYIRGVADGAGLFSRCAYHKQRPELEWLLQTAFTETNAFAICGSPGMGKTELARNFVHACCTGASSRLSYNYVIFTTYHKSGLKATVEQLPADSACSAAERYRLVMAALRSWGSSALLVIDNADLASDSLCDGCAEYADLLSSGCHILFTSRRSLDHCPGLRCLELEPLGTEQLKTLFREAAGAGWQGDDLLLTRLIEIYLQKNTYLVLLSAGLMKSLSLEELVDAFSVTGEISESSAVTKQYKDGRCQDSDTLMGHFRRLYDLHSLTQQQQELLLLLAFLPIDGMEHGRFFERAFPRNRRVQAQITFAELAEQHWAFRRDRRVCLHPMVKELVLELSEKYLTAGVSCYLHSTVDKLSHIHFSPDLLPDLAAGCAAYDVIALWDCNSFAAARLTAQIASVYDTLTDRLNAFSYGRDAVNRLDRINPQRLSRQDRYRMADSYNVSAYAISHYEKGEQHRMAEDALFRADRLLEQLLCQPESPEEQEACQILRTKVAGNLGACYHTVGDYRKSLAIHQENLAYRLSLQETYPGKHAPLVASAHKAVATEYFYLSRREGRAENLRNSLAHHRQSVTLYRQLGQDWQLELCIAVNRLVGTGLQLMALDPAMLDVAPEQFVCDAMAALEESMDYLSGIVPITGELRDCLRSTGQLLSLPQATAAVVTAARRILETAQTLPAATRQELAQLLQDLTAALS